VFIKTTCEPRVKVIFKHPVTKIIYKISLSTTRAPLKKGALVAVLNKNYRGVLPSCIIANSP